MSLSSIFMFFKNGGWKRRLTSNTFRTFKRSRSFSERIKRGEDERTVKLRLQSVRSITIRESVREPYFESALRISDTRRYPFILRRLTCLSCSQRSVPLEEGSFFRLPFFFECESFARTYLPSNCRSRFQDQALDSLQI